MNQPNLNSSTQAREEWLKVLAKGMVTLPKDWRDELGIKEGKMIKARKVAGRILIESLERTNVPYRIYSQNELKQFLKDDRLSSRKTRRIEKKFSLAD
jgi:AbrB family looped-hinge helix DNA binding protein